MQEKEITFNRFKDNFSGSSSCIKSYISSPQNTCSKSQLTLSISLQLANSPPPRYSFTSVNTCLCQSFPLLVGGFFGGPCCPQQKRLQGVEKVGITSVLVLCGSLWMAPCDPAIPGFPYCTNSPSGRQGPERFNKRIPNLKKGLKSLL